jgi:xanthine dehydrogenase accessory factor
VRKHVALDEHTYTVLMTHNVHDDAAFLSALLPGPTPYVGLLGPRTRADAVLAEAANGGGAFTAQDLQKLHAPVGLDVGAETPAEIAVAILAEIQAVRSGHAAGFLRRRGGPIHDPAGEDDSGGLLDRSEVRSAPAELQACAVISR